MEDDGRALPPEVVERNIRAVCKEISDFLMEKNKSYGNSINDPLKVFSRTGPEERLNVRMDDKLSRLARGEEYPGDDTEVDLLGYLVHKLARKRALKEMEQ